MKALHSLSLGTLTATMTLTAVSGIVIFRGAHIFSPGPLFAQTRSSQSLGGVRSHAELASRCSACHAPPWSKDTMSDRCLNCHEDVSQQLLQNKPLHGLMPEVGECRKCHTEHQGPFHPITDLASFDHSYTAFPLTGRHRDVSCAACHVNQVYKGTPSTCVACHKEPASHVGRFSSDCASCHNTFTWKDAIFEHSFPLNHGRGKRGASDCSVCHPKPNNYATYTCYGCHKHDPVKTEDKHLRRGLATRENILQCAACHPTGKKRKP